MCILPLGLMINPKPAIIHNKKDRYTPVMIDGYLPTLYQQVDKIKEIKRK